MHKSVIFNDSAAESGFTLIEMMVTVAVLVILAMVAGPGLQEYVARSGMTSVRNDFSVALQRARSDAISRNTCVSICQLASASAGTCASAGELGNWHKGWIIHVNNSCTTVAPAVALPPDDIIAVRQAGNDRYRLTDKSQVAPASLLTFDARGTLVSGGASFEVTDAKDKGSPNARVIVINMQGRVAVRSFGALAQADGESVSAEDK